MSDTVIKAEHLSKYYQLGVINNGTLFRDIQTWWAIKHGKEDPHGQIGSHKYDSNEDGFWALKDLNFEIKQGDRVGIIGKNGAGKSTLLKVLSRITAPTEGKVKIKGRVSSLLEVGTGFHAELTGRENIYLNGAILGMKKREVDRKIDEIIAFSEIENHIDTPVKRYSSGMYVRLAFAVAAHLDSEILIADEVLAVGDAAFQKKALGKMNELSTGQGRTVLFVSHNMSQVKNLCTKGFVLNRGELVFAGQLEKATKYYLNDNNISEKLINKIEIISPSLTLHKISIANSDFCSITIPFGTDTVPIEIQGTSAITTDIEISLILKTTTGTPLATFGLGHYEGKRLKLKKGDFTINANIKLPDYYGHGECLATFSISIPDVEYLAKIDNSIFISFEGSCAKKVGRVCKIEDNGLIGLLGNTSIKTITK